MGCRNGLNGASFIRQAKSSADAGGCHVDAHPASASAPSAGSARRPARGRGELQAQRSRNQPVHALRSQRPMALRLQFLLASRSLVAALRVRCLQLIRSTKAPLPGRVALPVAYLAAGYCWHALALLLR
jgi:hypothetical protein